MTLEKYLSSPELKFDVNRRAGIQVYDVYPSYNLMGTNYAFEFMAENREIIEESIGSGIIRWNNHVVSSPQLKERDRLDASKNFKLDFWHQDAGISGLIHLHHPTQEHPRLSNTLITSAEYFRDAFFEVFKALPAAEKDEIVTTIKRAAWTEYFDLFDKIARGDKSFFDRESFNEFAPLIQEAFTPNPNPNRLSLNLSRLMDKHLQPHTFRENWQEMDRTITINNKKTWHKRDAALIRQRAGILFSIS